ncbi:ABC transporter permease [Phycicoccus sp. BSK3Z-2]|uniref:ABC transporter permease n=1 Tax=Phycicoccus avicenniae TaxID=2828860 RepID=A0A941I0M0_9MICO|nr:ABC transporter permease [Phycicoccus avicenniae]MBR7743361.1 ABC transporter permease [Phycicoccus avicenniae]
MSTTTTTAGPTRPAGAAGPVPDGRPGVPLGRLLRVELRKLVDTRAGRWLLYASSAVAVVAVVAFLVWGSGEDATFAGLLGLTTLPLAIALPILGIMAATAEWSQRTGLVTFALEPHRGRVVAAKVLASVVLGAVVVVLATAGVALAYLVGSALRDGPADWSVPGSLGAGLALTLLVYLVQGVAFGLVFLNTPVAIVASLVLPTAFSIVSGLVTGFERVAVWLDLSLVTEPLTEGTMAGSDWAHLGTASLVWIGLPLVVGTWRVLTREVA